MKDRDRTLHQNKKKYYEFFSYPKSDSTLIIDISYDSKSNYTTY